MVKRKLIELLQSDGSQTELLNREIGNLDKKNLRKIRSREAIKEICFEVIGAVEKLILVHVDEQVLEKRKLKRQKDKPIKYDDTDMWNSGATIRNDWDTKRWLKNPPHGWIYYNEDGSLLGTIYEGSEKGKYEVFIRRDLAEDPHGTIVLIRVMKKRLGNIIGDKI